jgi:hypothetical protein
MVTKSGTDAAVGLRVHSGWASLVAIAGPLDSSTVVERCRIELADKAIRGSVQPYHAAEPMELKEAERFIERCRAASNRLARSALNTASDGLRAKGYRITACGLLQSSARPLPAIASILASHALIHTAEGELFRDALVEASTHQGLPVVRVKERELFDRCATELRVAADELQRRLAELGRALGPPWRQDEKFATLVAWLALAATKSAS